ncbi:uncharacterized protein A4U43_C08F4180 [Asparagus officinalis]|nr:uncharacterized protein A4U43_C08F4180 [Asparagus officinalis]
MDTGGTPLTLGTKRRLRLLRRPAAAAAAAPLKRPRSDYPDAPAGSEMLAYYPRTEERAGHSSIRDTETINASYDRYLRNGVSSFAASDPVRPLPGGMPAPVRPGDDPRLVAIPGMDGSSCKLHTQGGFSPLTFSVDIFRPFVGFREVRLVNKESRHAGGDPLVLCFVDFATANQAAVALEALQGYKFDEHERDSANLRLQFARFPGPRSSGGPRGRR